MFAFYINQFTERVAGTGKRIVMTMNELGQNQMFVLTSPKFFEATKTWEIVAEVR